MVEINRRSFLANSVALGVLAGAGHRLASAQSKLDITGVTWGGPWIAACKVLAAKQDRANVDWILHQGGAANIIAKIAATWPKAEFDFVHGTAGIFLPMGARDWVEPLTASMIPNMKQIPKDLFVKNAKGEDISLPVSGTGTLWGYDEAELNFKITKAEDLFSNKLKGKILATPPSYQFARFVVSLSLANGGSEKNIDPGFAFAKELAKAKMIGRVVKSDADVTNAFTSRDVSLGLLNASSFLDISKTRKLTPINRIPNSMFKTFLTHEGFAVMKGAKNREAVMAFLNFFIDPKINTEYAASIGHVPLNENSVAPAQASVTQLLTADERAKFGYIPDYATTVAQLPEWNRKWELEVAPLLQ